jgi:hypothetical protein
MMKYVHELEEGDEIIVSGLDLRYFKVIRKPMLRTNPTGWQNVVQGYKSVKVLETFEEVRAEHEPREIYMDLNYKGCWLVKTKN